MHKGQGQRKVDVYDNDREMRRWASERNVCSCKTSAPGSTYNGEQHCATCRLPVKRRAS